VKGWLVRQLPRAMAEDDVLARFTAAFEDVADGVHARIDQIVAHVDVGLAPPETLRYLGSWLGLQLEPRDPIEVQRNLVREMGRLLGWRGTRIGVEGLLAAATGSRVTVTDTGGVFGQRDQVPPADNRVRVRLDHTGHLDEQQVRALLAQELPLGAVLELDVRFPQAGAGTGASKAPGVEPGHDG
jgi:phage tail-like protein